MFSPIDGVERIEALQDFIEKTKALRGLISKDDHWCSGSCDKCRIKGDFDAALKKMEDYLS